MKIIINRLPEMTIQEFAKTYDLEMVVNEIQPIIHPNKTTTFAAMFGGCYAILNEGLSQPGSGTRDSIPGEGATPMEAIFAYAHNISFQNRFVIRKDEGVSEVSVPRITYDGSLSWEMPALSLELSR